MTSKACRCGNEVLVPDGHEGEAVCESCGKSATAGLGEALKQAKARRAAEMAKQDEVFRMRVDRLKSGPTRYLPGSAAAVNCPACKRPYVYNASMRLEHAPGGCLTPNEGGAQVVKIHEIRPVRRTWMDDDSDDEVA